MGGNRIIEKKHFKKIEKLIYVNIHRERATSPLKLFHQDFLIIMFIIINMTR